ncbi:hypothetical protein BYT27DRAFT_7115471 [Phlegmacium glaucopus]|nr:hypothetical protein BYT27DRAFT_7115471 [Phlegmacium glaucopus]
MSAPSTPVLPSTNAPADKAKLLTEDKMNIVRKWLERYKKVEKGPQRHNMLKYDVLPRLFTLNRHLKDDEWKLQKLQVKRWFQNQSRTSSATTRLSLKKNVSLKQVTCHIYKAEIASIAERIGDGAKPGTQQYIQFFQGALTEFMDGLDEESQARLEDERAKWQSVGHLPEIQRKVAQGMGQSFLEKSAQTQYNEMGMQSVVWEFHKNRAGMKLHDFNGNLGKVKVQSFKEKYPEATQDFTAAWIKYMTYCYEVKSGEQVELGTQSQTTTTLMELERDVKGFPLLPDASVGDTLAFMKKMI